MIDHLTRPMARVASAGDDPFRADWLAIRVRTGDLPLERLRLAAQLADPDALALLPDVEPIAFGCGGPRLTAATEPPSRVSSGSRGRGF